MQPLQDLENLFGMAFWLYFGKDFDEALIGADQKRRPLDSHHFLAIHVLFFQDTKLIRNRFVYISKERIREIILFAELLLGFRCVARDAKDHGPCVLDLPELIAKATGLDGAAGGVGFRIEEE